MRNRVILLALAVLSLLVSSSPVLSSARTLTIEERIEAQRAIEEVYWRHRTWPEANHDPKPPLSAVMTEATLRSRVEDYLRKSNALAAVWGRPVTSKQLQAEMERMARESKAPDVLSELFAALDNDPALIAETLVRQKLVERFLRDAYSYDDRKTSLDGWWSTERENYGISLAVGEGTYTTVRPSGSGCVDDTWRTTFDADIPDAMAEHTAVWTGTEMIVWGGYDGSVTFRNTGGRYDPSTDTWVPTPTGWGVPTGRAGHTAVWTGTEMIVWGGSNESSFALDTGGRYDPSTDTWVATSTGAGTPEGRDFHTAVWTGTEMIVWGGAADGGANLDTGGRYDPSTDAWEATSTGAVPPGRSRHTAVWTGTEMIVWGGVDDVSGGYANTGGRYDPSTDTWFATSTGVGAPSGRYGHTAVWAGTEMIVWGGFHGEPPYHLENTGGRYDPSTDTWAETSTGEGVPSGRRLHTVVWTGTEMIVWGGVGDSAYLDTGGRYDPTTDTWAETSTGALVPSRDSHTAVWTGTEMIVWGGWGSGSTVLNTGSRYDPSSDTWIGTSMDAGVPAARAGHTGVWTGTEMIVWGGTDDGVTLFNTGGRYEPSTNTWTATSTAAGALVARTGHTVVWTGTEMIVWGGDDDVGDFSYTGSRYDPAADTWTPTSTGAGRPAGRNEHTAVWTGAEMIVWGGINSDSPQSTGGRYNPSTDTWTATSTGAGVPSGRLSHSAVWTGTAMIVWGGAGAANTGGRYDPSTDTWAPTSTGAGVPSARFDHAAVWTGTEMLVWGGQFKGYLMNTGGRYNPSTNTWAATSTGAGVPARRDRPTALWTGTEMIVWGGEGDSGTFNSGGRYDPFTNTWVATSIGAGVPSDRVLHAAVWTGHEMIVWSGVPITSTGGLYCASARCTSSPSVCDDGDACTSDACDAGTHVCVNTSIACDDGNPCTTDSCEAATGQCLTEWITCYDDNVCDGYNSCDPATGDCIGGPPLICSDLNACNGPETCDPASGCVAGTPLVCDPPAPCQLPGVCDPYTGQCSYDNQPEGTSCDDGNACTGGSGGLPDSCDGAGTCIGGDPPNVSDGSECTIDYCDPETGAFYVPIDCDDGNVCNGFEACDPIVGCVLGQPFHCDDFNACSGVETCDPITGCVAGTPVMCAPPDQCHVAGVCNPGNGLCSYANQPNGTTCNDGNSATSPDACQNGVCVGEAGCTSTHNPRTVGFWRNVCRRGTFRGETIDNADAACVGQLSDTFAGFTTRNQVCNVLDGDHDHHDDYRRSSCSKAEDQLMALALNLCKERVCCDDGIDSRCDDNGHEDDLTFNHNHHGDDDDDDGHPDGDDDDDDDPDDGEGGTVCGSFSAADALLDDPSRTGSECTQAECLSKEVNNGHALEFATLVVRREGASSRLAWLSPVLNDGTARPESYRIWRRDSRSTAPFVQIGSTMGTEYLDVTGANGSWEYDVTAVLPDDDGDE